MPITIGSNIGSLQAQRRLADATTSLSKTFERLASGQRINRASDDAAGLAVSQSLNLSGRVYGQAVRNINDGFSLLAIADEAINSLVDINTRLQELAQQAANGVYSTRQRQSLDNEAQTLAKEYFRISRATQFNGTRLFDGSLGDGLRFQLGFGLNGSIHTAMGGRLGTGSLSVTITMGAESGSSVATALGDINGDGILDMVTAGSDTGGAGYATIRLGQGDGTFGAATSYTTETGGSLAVSLSDLNGDGVLDLVTAGNGGGSGRVTVRLGTGTGTFGAATSYQAESTSTASMSLGDLNGDGILDLVTAGNGGGAGQATVRLGNGNGTFGAASSISMHTTSAAAVTLGDINGDGILDLLTVGSDGGTQNATVRMGRGNGTFGASTSYATGDTGTYEVILGDLNGDGLLDLVTAGWFSQYIPGGGMELGDRSMIRLGTGSGTFGAAATAPVGGGKLKLADMNGDGNLDIVCSDNTNSLTVALGDGRGSFGYYSTVSSVITADATGAGRPPNDFIIGDLNGDGCSAPHLRHGLRYSPVVVL